MSNKPGKYKEAFKFHLDESRRYLKQSGYKPFPRLVHEMAKELMKQNKILAWEQTTPDNL